MNRIIPILKRYKYFLGLLFVTLIMLAVSPPLGTRALSITQGNLKEVLSVLPPIFILLGLLDVWVDRQTLIKYMGKDSKLKGALLAFVLGSAAAGPLYAAFPIAGILLKKGAKLSNVFLFIGAWSTTKIPMMLFEATNMGVSYMLVRWAFNLIGIVVIAFVLEKSLSEKDKAEIYEKAEKV